MNTTRLVLASLALALPLSACGGSGGEITANGPPDTSASADAGTGGTDQTLDEQIQDQLPIPEDLNLPEFDQLGECGQLAGTMAALSLAGVGGLGDAPENDIPKLTADAKALLPSDLHDEVDTIAEAATAMQGEGIIKAGQMMSDPKYTKAYEDISAYLNDFCSDPANGGGG